MDYLVPDWANAALVLIDVQNDFVSGPAAVPGTAERLPAMARAARTFRESARPIVHVVRSYRPGESDVDLLRRAGIERGDAVVEPGTPGALIAVELGAPAVDLDWASLRFGAVQQIGPAEYVLYKPRWSAFHRTALDEFLSDHDVTTVVVAGCNLPNCPRATLFDASERDYRTVLVTDATSQTTPERVADLAAIGVQTRTAQEVADAVRADETLGLAESLWVSVAGDLDDGMLDAAGGCDGWTVRDLVNHVIGGAERYALLLDGADAAATAATRGRDYLAREGAGDGGVDVFWDCEHRFREAAERADPNALVDHVAGRRPGAALTVMRVMELTLHSRDLAVALGTPWSPPTALVDAVLAEAADVIDELRAAGYFGPALDPVSDDPGDRLLAFAGRRGR